MREGVLREGVREGVLRGGAKDVDNRPGRSERV